MSTAFENSNRIIHLMFINNLISNLILLSLIIGFLNILKKKTMIISKWIKFPILLYLNLFIFFLIITFSNPKTFELTNYYKLILDSSLLISLIVSYVIYCKINTGRLYNDNRINVSSDIPLRFKNYIVDFIIILYYSYYLYVYFFYLGKEIDFAIIFSLYSLVYYFTFEILFKQTIGKLITNSILFTNQSVFKSIIIRTLSRHIPLEPFSFIFGKKKRWHDSFSNTELISENK